MSGKIIEEAVIVGALPIFETLELNLSGLLLFRLVYALARVCYVARIDCVENVELQSPDDICCILDIP